LDQPQFVNQIIFYKFDKRMITIIRDKSSSTDFNILVKLLYAELNS